MHPILEQVQAIFSAIQTAWPVILVCLTLVSSLLSTIATATTNHPTVSTWLHRILTLLSWAQHQNVPGWKWPFAKPAVPVVGQPVTISSSSGPVPLAKITLIFLALGFAGVARAQVISSGPSLSFLELRPGYSQPVQVAAGAGYQLSVGFLQASILGEEADLLDIGATVYGTDVTTPGGTSAGSLGIALFVGTLNELVAIGIGEDIVSAGGGVFSLPPYALLLINPMRVAFGSAPTVSGAPGVSAPRRFLTEYLGL